MGKVRKNVDLHESTVKNAMTLAEEIQNSFKEFEEQMNKLDKVMTPSEKKLNRRYSKMTSVTLHPLIVKFIKDNHLKITDFIVEGPESIILKEKLDV